MAVSRFGYITRRPATAARVSYGSEALLTGSSRAEQQTNQPEGTGMPAEAIVGVAAFAGLFTLWTIVPSFIRKRGK